jgi:hypothetical protein
MLFFYALLFFLFSSSVVALPNPFAGYWVLKELNVSKLLLYPSLQVSYSCDRVTTNNFMARFYKLKQKENITFWNLIRTSRQLPRNRSSLTKCRLWRTPSGNQFQVSVIRCTFEFSHVGEFSRMSMEMAFGSWISSFA